MKTPFVPVLLLLIMLLSMAAYLVMRTGTAVNDAPVSGLPWQIERLPDGSTRVFGISPGVTTLDQATRVLGIDRELAIIAAPDAEPVLEAYYGHYMAGPITGKLILVMDLDRQQLEPMQARGQRDGMSYRFRLTADDLAAAGRAAVRVVTFRPDFDLDADIVRARFGTPAEVIDAAAQQAHWLYPQLGLDVVLVGDGKEILQYLAPADFPEWRTRLP